jgi:hypothetical protein
MTTIWGFDPSKYTGWAIFKPEMEKIDGNCSHIKCGVFEMPEKADHYYTGDQIGLKVVSLIRDYGKPDFVVLEEQSLAKIGNSSADAMLYPWIATSAIVATLANFAIPYATIPAATWRVAFFGSGFKPAFKIHKLKKPDPKTGKTEKIEYLWKDACVSECERRGVTITGNKAIAHNAAEACALAMVGQSDKTKIHAGRYEGAWKAIRNTKFKAEPSLFGSAA